MNLEIGVTQTNKKINVKWNRSSLADGYNVYVQYCGKKISKPAKIINNNKTTKAVFTKLNGKKLNLKKQFKVFVEAYKLINGKKITLTKSISAHIAGSKNRKYTNPKTLILTKSNFNIKIGKSAKIKAKIKLADKKKKHLTKGHGAKFRYRSTNSNIATVSKSGKIKGIKKGTCTIYVYAINGKMKKVKVTIK